MSEGEVERPLEYVSMKFLLKQVYAAHTTKVKELESEISELKEDLEKTKRASTAECKKCREIESAYTTCKEKYQIAVAEHTRRLKELEQVFCAAEKKCDSNKDGISHTVEIDLEAVPFTQSDNFTVCDDEDEIIQRYCGKQNSPLKYYSSTDINIDTVDITGPQISNLEHASKEGSKLSRRIQMSSDKSDAGASKDVILVPDTLEPDTSTKKRLSCQSPRKSSRERIKKLKADINKENTSHKDKNIAAKPLTPKKKGLTEITSNTKISQQKVLSQDKEQPTFKKPQNPDLTLLKEVSSVNDISQSVICTKKQKVHVKDSNWAENFKDFNTGKKTKSSSFTDLSTDDDFENSKDKSDVKSWKSSKKDNKLTSMKNIKSTSKFKLVLEPPGPHIKPINYKQMKLSPSIFQLNKSSNIVDKKNKNDGDQKLNMLEKTSVSPKSSHLGISELASLIDSDTTFEPAVTKQPDIITENVPESETYCQIYPDSDASIEELAIVDGKDADMSAKDDDDQEPRYAPREKEDLCDSFDRLPIVEEPKYKYKEETVRSKNKRKQLEGFECKDCEKYYSDLPENERKVRLKQCSRHRSKYAPPATPEHYWELDFPDSEICRERGYVAETQKVQLKTRRRRPLE